MKLSTWMTTLTNHVDEGDGDDDDDDDCGVPRMYQQKMVDCPFPSGC